MFAVGMFLFGVLLGGVMGLAWPDLRHPDDRL